MNAFRLSRAGVVLCLAMGLSFEAQGQDYRAKVTGLVTDPSGGVVGNTLVTLTNTNTGTAAKRTSGENGGFVFDFVEPGTYSLAAELAGFSRFVQENILVQVRSDVTVNVVLRPGTLDQQITVTDTPPAIEFNTSSSSLTIDRKMLTDLPILARNPFTLAMLDPGVVNTYWTDRNPFYMWSSTYADVGGGTTGSLDLLLDGAPLTLTNKGSYAPPMDAVQEFTVQLNTVDTEFGFSSGATESLSTRSGTNAVHGTAYYFGRNPALNAVSNAIARSPNTVRNHVWGGTLGNRIIKDKLFTFTAWEQWRTSDPRSNAYTLPTDLERTGDFSKSLALDANKVPVLRTIYDPWSTHLAADGKYLRTPYPENKIPERAMDPAALKFMQDVWKPNRAADDVTGVNNFREAYSWLTRYWNLDHRADYYATEKLRMFFRYSQFHNVIDESHSVQSRALPYDEGGIMHALNYVGDAVWSLGPTTVLNFTGSFTSIKDDYASRQSVTAQELSNYWPNQWYTPVVKDLPVIYYPNFTVGPNYFGHRFFWFEHPKNLAFSGKLVKSAGAHTIKAGLQYRRYFGFIDYPDPMSFSFGSDLTAETFQSPNTLINGNPWATFLVGALDSNTTAAYTVPHSLTSNIYGAFLQDDFRVSRRVTLNLGLRYEYQTAPVEDQNRMGLGLDLGNPIPEMQSQPPQIPAEVAAIAQIPYKFNGAWMFAGNNHRGIYRTNKLSFAPRLGVAIELNSKMALRGGWARFILPPDQAMPYQAGFPQDGFSARTYEADPITGIPQARLADPFPATYPLILPTGNSLGRYQNLGSSASWIYQDLKTAIHDRVSVSLQREVIKNFVAEATYYVNRTSNLAYSRNLNMMDPSLSYTHKAALDASVPNPFYGYLTAEKFPGSLRNQPEVSIGSLLVPYPQYGSLTETRVPGARDLYQSFEIKVRRPFTNGLSLYCAYNYNRQKTEQFFNAPDTYANRFTYIDAPNPRHRMNIAGSYDLPFGKGRPFMDHAPAVFNAALGGWSTSWILSYVSGAFLVFPQAIVSGDPAIDNPTRARYFNTSVFSVPEPYTPRTNPWVYSGVTGPRFGNVDATLSKYFPITESIKLEFKMEAYNLTNSFMASAPSMDVYSSLFGRSTGQANRGREMQYTMRLHF